MNPKKLINIFVKKNSDMKQSIIIAKFSRLIYFFLTYFLFIFYFLADKVFFMLFHWEQTAEQGFTNIFKVLWNGFLMDVSMAGYLVLIPGIIVILSFFFIKGLQNSLKIYYLIFCFLINIIVITDINLYSFWGFRIDATVFNYINSPKEAAASVSAFRIIMICAAIIIWTLLQYYFLRKILLKFFPNRTPKFVKTKIISAFCWILLLGILIIPIRGGLSTATMNVSRVYFSNNIFLNHSAINPVFYMLNSFEQQKNLNEQYRYMSDDEAEKTVNKIIATDQSDNVQALNLQRPNIIFIILESFGKQVIENLGGEKGVTPNLNRYINEGVFFSNMYANSFRTDRGIVSVLAGLPAQPSMSILKYPQKTQALPSIPQALINNDYSASFLHGGDLNFANIRSFIVSQGITDITMDKDFPIKYLLTKWGARDEFAFSKLQEQIAAEKNTPYFKAFLTLSSHEPFDVPTVRFDDPYLNSVFYTDSCLGVFVDEIKKRADWENTLIVMVPDHNMRYPYNIEYFAPERHQVFMLWMGGAVKKPMVVDKICSQTDIASTLLTQLDIESEEFIFSRNVLSADYKEFAFYDFPNGFGVAETSAKAAYDCTADKELLREGENTDSLFVKGKAYLQFLYNYLDDL